MCDLDIENIFQCRGHTNIPDTWQELMEYRVEDNWNINLKCVINRLKYVAVTDYDSIENPEGVEEYYEFLGGIDEHIALVEKAKECGVGLLIGNDGTHYYYRSKKNAELLMKYGFLEDKHKLPKKINREIYRSLLMGYTDLSIILYQLVNDQDQYETLNDENYMDTVDEYIKEYTPQVKSARNLIKKQGGDLFDD